MNKNYYKKIIAALFSLILVFCSGCSKPDTSILTELIPDTTEQIETTTENIEITEPILKNAEVKKIATGFKTLFAEIENPNDFDIDFVFKVDYLDKDGEICGNPTNMIYNCLGAKKTGGCWYNFDIPEEANDIRITYSTVIKSEYSDLEVEYQKAKTFTGDHGASLPLEYSIINYNENIANCETIVFFIKDGKYVGLDDYMETDPQESNGHVFDSCDFFDDYHIFSNCYQYK